MTEVCNFCECVKTSVVEQIRNHSAVLRHNHHCFVRASSPPCCLVILWWTVLSDPEGLVIADSGPCQHSKSTTLQSYS